MTPAVFEEDVRRIEEQIRRLETEYNRYFTGSSPRPPSLLQGELATRVRRRMEAGDKLSSAQKFRLESIISRFHILSEMWIRNVRNIEEGRPAVLDRRSPEAPLNRHKNSAEKEIFRVSLSLSGTRPEAAALKNLYDSYLSVAAPAGGTARTVSYQNFYRQIHQRLEKIGRERGSDNMVCRIVIVDNHPVLKVRSVP